MRSVGVILPSCKGFPVVAKQLMCFPNLQSTNLLYPSLSIIYCAFYPTFYFAETADLEYLAGFGLLFRESASSSTVPLLHSIYPGIKSILFYSARHRDVIFQGKLGYYKFRHLGRAERAR